MASPESPYRNDYSNEKTNVSVSSGMREVFFAWLSDGNARRFTPQICVDSIDRVSDYITNTGILPHSVWHSNDYDAFVSIFAKLRDNRQLRRIDRNAYEAFMITGKLYRRFLKELSWKEISAHDVEVSKSEKPAIDRVDDKQYANSISDENASSIVPFSKATPIKAEESLATNSDVKVGVYVRKRMSQLSESGFVFTAQQLRDICDIRWSEKNLKLGKQYPFAKKVDGTIPVAVLSKDEKGCNRYWNQVFAFGDVNLIFSNNWFERSRVSFEQWFSTLRSGIPSENRFSSNISHVNNNNDAPETAYSTNCDELNKNTSNQTVQAARVTPMIPQKPTLDLDSALTQQIMDILAVRFSNGFRLNSPIEMMRFRSFAAEKRKRELSLSDEELKTYIASCGIIYEDKVYAVSNETKARLKKLTEDYFDSGAQAIFYDEFYAKNEKWLFEASVVSKDVLIDILRDIFPSLSFTRTYFGYNNASTFAVLEREMLRVWGDDILLTYGQLAERLPYIPLVKIKQALGQNGNFIWNSVETFSHISRIQIAEGEREAIRAAAIRKCNAQGYASITDLLFGEIDEHNCRLSVTAIHNAVYRICLSDKFDKKGKIITRKGDVFDALTIMKEYCRTIDKCSLTDLLALEKELTGEVHRWIPMEAGSAVLVRVDKDAYFAERYVHFNKDAIDDAIEMVLKGDYLPLKAFTTFGVFPDCGQAWNLFLLESYCRRFSRKFRFDAPAVNSRNAGAVIRKSCGMEYTEIMMDAVANSDVPLTADAVGRFLYDSGYIGKSTTAKLCDILNGAKTLRRG